MQYTSRSGIQCRQHPKQQYANICTSIKCLKPLCPDCVQIHTKIHDKQQILSWKHCVQKQINTIRSTVFSLETIQKEQSTLSHHKSINQVEELNIRILNSVKSKIKTAIEQIFQVYEQQLRSFIRKNYKLDVPDISDLKKAIKELNILLDSIRNPINPANTKLQGLKRSLSLDYQRILKRFQPLNIKAFKHVPETFFVEDFDLYQRVRQVLENSLMASRLKQVQEMSSPSLPANRTYESVQQNNPFEGLQITVQNYFNQSNSKSKFLHFFIPSSKQVKVLDVESVERGKVQWKSLVFYGNKQIPCYFKSIISPEGKIYLTGGSDKGKRSNEIYQYNYEKNSLELVCRMKYERSSHSICYADGLIYLVGGFSNVQGDVTRSCQVFNPKQRKCSQISSLNAPSANSGAVSFNNEYIFKLGGVQNKMQGNNLIEMYSIKKNKWIVVDIEVDKSCPQLQLLSFSAAVQINQNQLLVFGGYDNSEIQRPQRLCYSLQVNANKGSVRVRNYNTTPLPYAQGFWNNNPIIHNKKIFALQNINDPENQLTAVADQNRVIVFDGDRWY